MMGAERALGADGKHATVAGEAARGEDLGAAGRHFFRLLGFKLGVEAVGSALSQASVVGKNQGGVMAAYIVEDARDDRGPDGGGGQLLEVVYDGDDPKVQRLAIAGVDDSDGAWSGAAGHLAAEEAGSFFEGADGGGEADALEACGRAGVWACERCFGVLR
jgi:hypothetical protein